MPTPDTADFADYLTETSFDILTSVGEVPQMAVWNPSAYAYDVSGRTPLGSASENPADHLSLGVGYWARIPFTAAPLDGVILNRPGLIATDPMESSMLDRRGRFEIRLKPGWNMIGDPFAEAEGVQPTGIALSAMYVDNDGLVTSLLQADFRHLVSMVFFRYDPSSDLYVPIYEDNQSTSIVCPSSPTNTSIYPYIGYWVYSWTNSTLLIPHP
jgi:hypothetical protein